MEPNSLKWVGSSCGFHGPSIFYKAFSFLQESRTRLVSLGDFFLVRLRPSDPVCVAELQLLWEERSSKVLLSSSRLYFLPEDSTLGRTVNHGEHEVVAATEKVTVRLKDLVRWTVPDSSGWTHGLEAEPIRASELQGVGTNGRRDLSYRETTHTCGLNFKDVQKEREQLSQDDDRKLLVLSYPQYCRYRSVMLRLQDQSSLLVDATALALGGIAALTGNTRILFCRDSFEHPTLMQNLSVCEQFAPNLKGRPRKKKLSISQRRDSQGQSQGQGSSGSVAALDPSESKSLKVKSGCKAPANGKISSRHKKCCSEEKEGEQEKEERREEETEEKREEEGSDESREEEQTFLMELYKYMKERDTPIERIPFLGFKQINLWTMFQAAHRLGGYELITVRRQWKHVYDELGGNPSSTSAATCTRRHYERLLLPYERHLKGETDKPLPLMKPRKDVCLEKMSGLKVKSVMNKKLKNAGGPGVEEKQVEAEPSQTSMEENPDSAVKRESYLRDEPIVIEEEELHLTLKKEESSSLGSKDLDCRSSLTRLPLHARPGLQPEWRQISEVLHAKLTSDPQTEGHFLPKNLYLPHHWDLKKSGSRHESTSRVKDLDSHGGRVGKVLPICKEAERQPVDLSSDSSLETDEYLKKDCGAQMAYKSSQGVMSPLAKKKLLSQVCESRNFSYAPSQREDKRKGEEEILAARLDNIPEVAPIFRPSVIQHAQSSRHGAGVSENCRTGLQSQAAPPWQPYLPRVLSQEEAVGDKLLQNQSAQGGAFDCYSSPHLHSLYRQTCLSQERKVHQEHYSRDGEGSKFMCAGLEQEGLAFRTNYSDKTHEILEDENEPRDFTISKPSRGSSFSKPGNLPYSILTQGPDSHPKACRVSPMTVSPRKSPAEQSFPSPKSSSDPSFNGTIHPRKRVLSENEGVDVLDRKVRVVTPIHPACAIRRSDPEELKLAEPGHAVHINNHLPDGPSYPSPHTTAHLYAGLYPGLVTVAGQDGLQHHPGLQYLKSQSAVSPLMPPLAFHSMMLHRQLLASNPGTHHFYRHPGGAALYGDLLHHLYPLSTLPPSQLSSVHPSTRL